MEPKRVIPPPPPQLLLSGFDAKLLESLTTSYFDSNTRQFLPHKTGNDLVTKEVIWQELQLAQMQLSPDLIQGLVQWILDKARKVFLTLIRCHMTAQNAQNAMHRFWYHGYDDERLSESQLSPEDMKSIFTDGPWLPFTSHDFLTNYRWGNLSPVFRTSQYEYHLHENAILPFTKKGVNYREGAFSWVHRVSIHPEHTEHEGKEFAFKEIHVKKDGEDSSTNEAWEREARALASINKIKHPHIIPCMAAITRNYSRYFMFPWATGDSLKDFWIGTREQSPSADLIKQSLTQLLGLADALSKLHNYVSEDIDDIAVKEHGNDSIRHGDLKPENLLRFLGPEEPLGTLTIGDMGLAKKHVILTEARNHMTTTRYGTIQYQPPEVETHTNGGMSRLYDIWSMGCIIFEFVIWLLHGNDMLERFYSELRGNTRHVCPYYELPPHGSNAGATVHGVVKRWINHIRQHEPECATESVIGDLLKLVQEKLLVIDLPPPRGNTLRIGSTELPDVRVIDPPSSGNPGPRTYRATSEGLCRGLEAISEKVRTRGSTYVLTSTDRGSIILPPLVKDKQDFLLPGHAAPKLQRQETATNNYPEGLTVSFKNRVSHPAIINAAWKGYRIDKLIESRPMIKDDPSNL
ncbi:serine/threonine protein kinase [Apiospora sp. TS-2023a]